MYKFEAATSQLIHHPEYNSTLILRSETVAETDQPEDLGSLDLPDIDGFVPLRSIHRKLLPRRPGRDAGLEQHCTLYAPAPGANDVDQTPSLPSLLVLTPIAPADGSPLPYYHPTVHQLAMHLISGDDTLTPDKSGSRLCIDVVPHAGTSLDPGARLARTCLALLETLHRYLWGAATDYRKRVAHDRIVPREEYQDMYLIMRERHKHLVNEWHESTDPLKHVFEDIGIATYLMMLWKTTDDASYMRPSGDFSEDEPWRRWPRPAGGFIDLGCGNGLLTHILTAEGYAGQGIDLRARVSWEHYPPASRAALRVLALDPTSEELSDTDLPANAFLIGNHADELSPWVPVLATRTQAAGYLSIPCCAWSFDARFDRTRDVPYEDIGDEAEFVESLGLGADGSTSSSYAAYRVWLASLSAHCGWVVECDALRIPSTRNWAIVGRKRSDDAQEEVQERIDNILLHVKQRGVFKTRRPEGKAGEH
ncbi:unnamed protein product [Peniophora sp. CBMAI 1063]|nr:unnamed protein product [Peniophora sp. CBMAI 1063]